MRRWRAIDRRRTTAVGLAPLFTTPVASVSEDKDTLSFEDALAELEALVETLEQGELSLEDSLQSFERGVSLTKTCQQALKQAEHKVNILSANSADAEAEPFDRDD